MDCQKDNFQNDRSVLEGHGEIFWVLLIILKGEGHFQDNVDEENGFHVYKNDGLVNIWLIREADVVISEETFEGGFAMTKKGVILVPESKEGQI